MNYFTAQLWSDINGPRAKAAMEEWDRNVESYRQQLSAILPRLSARARLFFRGVSLHDGTLTRMEVGDRIDDVENTWDRGEINNREARVRLRVLSAEGDGIFQLEYTRITRVDMSLPGKPLFAVGRWPNFGDWGYDELSEVRSDVFRHEVLFSSGATILIEFERFNFTKSAAKRMPSHRKS